ncbi:MAG: DUF1273 domain-containing protein [Ruminococcus sp.]|nr:DUF1273 domain-containing protein [Ruminococcus sp.]
MKSACFTGHRRISGNITKIKKNLYNTLEYYINKYGLTDFYAGGAVGWDTISAIEVIKLRIIYPQIKLHMILPCSNEEQTKYMNTQQKEIFYNILRFADSIEYVSQNYYNGCMKLRNARLVEYADCCLCYFNPDNKYSGTFQTVNMANKKNIAVINFFHYKK